MMSRSLKIFSRTYIGWCVALITVLFLGTAGFAQTGQVIAESVPSSAAPNPNDEITVAIQVDVSGVQAPDNQLSLYQATLSWDPSVLQYAGYLPGEQPWGSPSAITEALAANGSLSWIDLTLQPASGKTTVINFKFKAVGAPGSSTTLGLGFTRMKSDTLKNLLDLLTVRNGIVQIAGVSAPDISISQSSYDFGAVTVGSSASHDFVVRNEGAADLEVTAATFSGTAASQFSIASGAAPFTLGQGESRTVTVQFSPTSEGAKGATLQFASNDPDENPAEVVLAGTGVPTPVPDIAVGPTSYDFGAQMLGSTSSQTFVVTNEGTADLVVNATTLTGPDAGQFSIVSGGAPFTLAPGATRDVVIGFSPTAIGSKSASLRFGSNDPDENPLDVILTGSVVTVPKAVVTPLSHDFGDVLVGQTASQPFVITNTGTAPLQIVGMGLEGPDDSDFWFLIGSLTGPAILPPGQSRQVVVSFKPTSEGARSAKMVVVTNDPSALSIDIPLTGNGVGIPGIAFNPTAFDFGSVTVGSNSSQTLLISNTGTAALVVDATTLIGPDAGQFSLLSGGAPFTLPPGQSRNLVIGFSPGSAGAKNASIRFSSNDPNQPSFDFPLTGMGVLASVPDIAIDPPSYDFGTATLGSTTSHTFAVTNRGTADLVVSAITLAGANPSQFSIGGGTSFTLSPGGTRDLVVNFVPTARGSMSAALRISSNDPDQGTLDVGLAGLVPMPLDVHVDLPDDAVGEPGTSVTIPIVVDNVTGKKIFGYRAVIEFDKNVLKATGATSIGTLSQVFGKPIVSTVAEGKISVGGVGTVPLSGSGVLVNLHFKVVGQAGDWTALTFDKFEFNLGRPPATTDDGKFTVKSLGVPDITVNPTSHDYGTVTVGSSSSKTFEVSNEGTAPLGVAVTMIVGPDADQFSVASGGAPFGLLPGSTHDVVVNFSPTSPGLKNAALQIVSNDPDENPVIIPLSGKTITLPTVRVDLPDDASGLPGTSVTIPITVSDLTGLNIRAYGGVISFDETVLRATGASSAGTLSQPLGPPRFVKLDDDLIAIGAIGATPLSGSGTLVNLHFDVVGQPGDVSPLVFVKFLFDTTGVPVAVTDDGKFTVLGPPDIAVSPGSIDFGEVEVGKEKDLQVTVSNEGSSDLHVSATELVGTDANQWQVKTGAAPFTLAPGQSRELTVSFNPTSPGAKNASLRIRSDDPDEDPVDVALTGSGFRPPHLTIDPTSYDYGDVEVGKYVDKTFVLRNSSSATKNAVGHASLRGDPEFSIVSGRDFDIPPGGSHEIVVRFDCREQEPADPNAILRIISNDPNSPITVSLSGECVEPIQPDIALSTGEVKFGKVQTGSQPKKTLIVSNVGNADLQVTSIQFRGSNKDQYIVTGAEAPFVLAPGQQHQIMVQFRPTSEGLKVAHLRFETNDPDEGVVNAFLSGTGVLNPVPDIAVEPTSLDFGDLMVSTSAEKQITVLNEGTRTLEVSATYLTGSGADQWKVTGGQGPFSLEPGETHQLAVSFQPTSQGAKSATLRIRSNDPDESPLDIPLRGNGSGPPTARVQAIHNAPDSLVAVVDVYVNGELLFDDLSYRSATPFTELPAGVPIEVSVAPGNSNSVTDSLKSVKVVLEPNATYVVVASGVIDTTRYAANPDGRDIMIRVFVKPDAREKADSETAVDLAFHHGSTDLPTVDLVARGIGTLADNAAYGDISDYASVPPGTYVFDLAAGDDPTTLIASFDADLSDLRGASAFVFASGFLHPASNDSGPSLGLFAALADGTVREFPRITAPRIAVEPMNLEYGKVDVGATRDKLVTVSNTGFLELDVTKSSLAGPQADQWKVVEGGAPFALAPGASRVLKVRFAPSAAGEAGAKLQFHSNDPNAPLVEVALAGEGVEPHVPDIAARPEKLRFGPVEIGKQAEKILEISNKGDADLKVSKMELRGSNADQYKILDAEAPFVLAPGKTKKIMVQFSPTAENRQIAHIRFYSNDPDEDVFNVFMTGRGVPSPTAQKQDGLKTAGLGDKSGVVIPKEYSLSQNYPNPFNPETVIEFGLPKAGPTRLEIYDVQGHLVRRLVDGSMPAGLHAVRWDGRDESGRRVSSGIYLYRLKSGSFVERKQMTLVK